MNHDDHLHVRLRASGSARAAAGRAPRARPPGCRRSCARARARPAGPRGRAAVDLAAGGDEHQRRPAEHDDAKTVSSAATAAGRSAGTHARSTGIAARPRRRCARSVGTRAGRAARPRARAYRRCMARLALVTGASTGIGRACALHLAGRGFEVLAGVRDPDAPPGPETLPLDITSEAHVAAAARVGDGSTRSSTTPASRSSARSRWSPRRLAAPVRGQRARPGRGYLRAAAGAARRPRAGGEHGARSAAASPPRCSAVRGVQVRPRGLQRRAATRGRAARRARDQRRAGRHRDADLGEGRGRRRCADERDARSKRRRYGALIAASASAPSRWDARGYPPRRSPRSSAKRSRPSGRAPLRGRARRESAGCRGPLLPDRAFDALISAYSRR